MAPASKSKSSEAGTSSKGGEKVRIWWPPSEDESRSDFGGAYWPAKVVSRTGQSVEVVYDNGEKETVDKENVSPLDLPVEFGEEDSALQVGEFCEVSNGSKTDPGAWVGRVAKVTNNGYTVEYPFHDAKPESVPMPRMRRARIWQAKKWQLLKPSQAWQDGDVTHPHELEVISEKDLQAWLKSDKKVVSPKAKSISPKAKKAETKEGSKEAKEAKKATPKAEAKAAGDKKAAGAKTAEPGKASKAEQKKDTAKEGNAGSKKRKAEEAPAGQAAKAAKKPTKEGLKEAKAKAAAAGAAAGAGTPAAGAAQSAGAATSGTPAAEVAGNSLGFPFSLPFLALPGASPAGEDKRKKKKDPNEPKRPNPWLVFYQQQLPGVQQQLPGASGAVHRQAIQERYRALSIEEREKLDKEVERLKAQYEAAKKNYVAPEVEAAKEDEDGEDGMEGVQHSAEQMCALKSQLQQVQQFMVQQQQEEQKKKAKKAREEGGVPKKRTAFVYFVMEHRKTLPEQVAKEQSKVSESAGKAWGEMSEAAKAPYNALAEADKARYEEELAVYEAKKRAERKSLGAATPALPTPAEVDSWAKMYKAAYTKLMGSVAGAGSPAAAQAGTSAAAAAAAAGQALGGTKSSGGKKAAK